MRACARRDVRAREAYCYVLSKEKAMADSPSVVPTTNFAIKVVIVTLLTILALEVLRKWGIDPIGMVVGFVPGPRTNGGA